MLVYVASILWKEKKKECDHEAENKKTYYIGRGPAICKSSGRSMGEINSIREVISFGLGGEIVVVATIN